MLVILMVVVFHAKSPPSAHAFIVPSAEECLAAGARVEKGLKEVELGVTAIRWECVRVEAPPNA